jgi:gliding motility-associated-like protein
VETTGYGCSNTDSFRIVLSTADFSYEQNPCDPLKVTFKNETPGSTVIDWDFGNGANAPGNENPVTQYPSFGSYNVTLTVINSNGINESITKSIAVEIQNDNLIITSDTTICAGSSIQLNAVNALNYCWTPSETLSAPDIANPVASPQNSTVYYLNTLITGQNIIVNGDFSAGNTGFKSEYKYVANNTTEGEYFVGNSSLAWNPHLIFNCTDHSGTGNMLLVNGSPEDNKIVWTQTINVISNTNYAFSTWIESHFSDNPAQLEFFINGIGIGNPITASLPICNWTQFYTTWNSGNNTSAVISIVNKNTVSWGNDFALDDISFAPVTIRRDSVIITVEEPAIQTIRDTTICEGAGVHLDATAGFASYTWLPATGLSDQKIMTPIAMPVVTTDYIVTGKTVNGCDASDTVNIAVNKAPDFITNNDTLLCGAGQVQLSAIGDAISYAWSPGTNLPDSTVSDPLAEVLSTTQFVVMGKSADNCFSSDTVRVIVSVPVDIQARSDTSICEGVAFQLYTTGDAAGFSWSPSSGLSDPSIKSPVAHPLSTTEYVITASNPDGCADKDTVLVTVKSIPVVSITHDTLICPEVNVRLNATGGSSYSWTPSATLSDPFIADPTAAPVKNTTYVVEVNDIATGCTSSDSVAITLRPYPVFSAIADTAVCRGTDILMYANGGDSYQWSPAASLDNPFSANPVAQPLSSTIYSVYMTENTCHFDTTIDVHITVNPVPEVTAQRSNDINCLVTTAQLNATGANAYQWSPAVHLDNAFKPNPVAGIDTTTLFKVVGKNNYGCMAEDTVTVKVTKEGNPLYLVPNAFTPNGDGVNDCFSVRKWGNIQLEELSVYNRWGEKVFYSKNLMDCWDGTYKGVQQPSGTFVYVIRAKSFCGPVYRKGLVTLIR